MGVLYLDGYRIVTEGCRENRYYHTNNKKNTTKRRDTREAKKD